MDSRILVVDDDWEVSRLLKLGLESRGFRVALASDGASALDLLEQERADLILSDVRMPCMDGHELLQAVRERTEWSDIPFILMSATTSQQEIVAVESSGADAFVAKPFGLQDMAQVIQECMRKIE